MHQALQANTHVRTSLSLTKLRTATACQDALVARGFRITRVDHSAALHHKEDDVGSPCYLLNEPATLKEMVIDSATHLEGHILVCMHHNYVDVFRFIYHLR